MKRHIKLLSILPTIASIPIVASCACNPNAGYKTIPTTLLKIENNKIVGFNNEEQGLSKDYDTLQVPDNVIDIEISKTDACQSYDCIVNIIGNDNGKWQKISSVSNLLI